MRDRAYSAAHETGRQMWPAGNLAEYRLALDAPAEYAAGVLTDEGGRFALGPLSEVAASTHTWADLAAYAPPTPVAALTAHERVVRGEQVDPATVAHPEVLTVPLVLEPWEPEYFVPTYRPERVEESGPDPIRGRPLAEPTGPPEQFFDAEVEQALRELVRPWTARSEGTARVSCVHGDVAAAIAALGAREVRGAYVDAGEAIALLAWAGASGGRHARRRGAAAGRDLAWAAAGVLCGFEPGESTEAAELGDAISELRWYVWTTPDGATGWILRVAVEDQVDGVAYACDAVDPGGWDLT